MKEEAHEWEFADSAFCSSHFGDTGECFFLRGVGEDEGVTEKTKGIRAEDRVGDESELMGELQIDEGLFQIMRSEGREGCRRMGFGE